MVNPVEYLWANLKDLELASRPTTTLAEVADATEQGIQRICKSDSLVVGFLVHTGLALDPMNRQPNPRNSNKNRHGSRIVPPTRTLAYPSTQETRAQTTTKCLP